MIKKGDRLRFLCSNNEVKTLIVEDMFIENKYGTAYQAFIKLNGTDNLIEDILYLINRSFIWREGQDEQFVKFWKNRDTEIILTKEQMK